MKTISCISVLLFLFIGSAVCDIPPEVKEILKKRQDECYASHPVDNKILNEARNGNFANDISLKEYIFCNLHEGAFLTAEGALRPQIAQVKLSLVFGKEVAEKLLEKCKPTPDQDKLDVAVELVKCLYADTKTTFF